MVLRALVCSALARAVLGAALLVATGIVYAAGGHWFSSNVSSCTPDSSGTNYVGVCKTGADVASDAKVVFDNTTGAGTADSVYGGSSVNGVATGNTVTVSGGSVDGVVLGGILRGGSVHGGYSRNGEATDNSVVVSGGTVIKDVFGGSSHGNAIGNSVTVSGGTIGGAVFGGFSLTGGAIGNTVTVSGGKVGGDVFGGFGNHGDATGNTVTVSGGTVGGDVVGGGTSLGDATGNRVILMGSPVFGPGTRIFGGQATGDAVIGNVLDVHTKGLDAFSVQNFEQYSFYLPVDTKAGDTVLTLTGPTTDLKNAKVGVMMQSGGHLLQKGDRVALVHNSNGVDSTGVKQVELNGYSGISLKYTFGLSSDTNNLYAVTESGPQVREQTKALVEGRVAPLAFSLQGADLIAGAGMDNAVGASGAGGAGVSGGINAFGAMSGSNSRYNTGSHVDVDGTSLMLGVAKKMRMGVGHTGSLTLGAFFEGGWGRYDTYNDFDSGNVHGSGSADYVGGGVLARQDWVSGLYAEGSVRAGRMRSDWSSADMGVADASYDTSAPYYGAHVGLGVVWPINTRTAVDVSAKYFWAHQNSEDAEIAGDPYHFESMDSQRTRLGARVTYAFTDHVKGYVGAAWDHEYDGVARATVYGLDTPSPSLKGDTGVFEAGVSIKPDASRPLTVALGVQGYVGQREGVGGTLNVGWAF